MRARTTVVRLWQLLTVWGATAKGRAAAAFKAARNR